MTIILCADDEDRLLPTVRSRCARLRLGRVGRRDVEAILAGARDRRRPAGRPARPDLGRPARRRPRLRPFARGASGPGANSRAGSSIWLDASPSARLAAVRAATPDGRRAARCARSCRRGRRGRREPIRPRPGAGAAGPRSGRAPRAEPATATAAAGPPRRRLGRRRADPDDDGRRRRLDPGGARRPPPPRRRGPHRGLDGGLRATWPSSRPTARARSAIPTCSRSSRPPPPGLRARGAGRLPAPPRPWRGAGRRQRRAGARPRLARPGLAAASRGLMDEVARGGRPQASSRASGSASSPSERRVCSA